MNKLISCFYVILFFVILFSAIKSFDNSGIYIKRLESVKNELEQINQEMDNLYQMADENAYTINEASDELYSDVKDFPYDSEEASGDCDSILSEGSDKASEIIDRIDEIKSKIYSIDNEYLSDLE